MISLLSRALDLGMCAAVGNLADVSDLRVDSHHESCWPVEVMPQSVEVAMPSRVWDEPILLDLDPIPITPAPPLPSQVPLIDILSSKSHRTTCSSNPERARHRWSRAGTA